MTHRTLAIAAALTLLTTGCGLDDRLSQRDRQPNTWCLETPSCDEGADQVTACAPNNDLCHEVSACGLTIACQQRRSIPDPCGGVPTCDDGSAPVSTCPDGATCAPLEVCDFSGLCVVEGPVLCDAAPTCPGDQRAVPSCEDATSRCNEITVCGQTIGCVIDAACEEVRCDPDYRQDPGPCAPTDEDCYELSSCPDPVIISCSRQAWCDGPPPTCPDGYTNAPGCAPTPAGLMCNACANNDCITVRGCTSLVCHPQRPPTPCDPMDARGAGLCEAELGTVFTGDACHTISGCSCVGADCDDLYTDIDTCTRTHLACLAP